MHNLLPPQAYINFETLDVAIGFFKNKIPKGYEGVYTESYLLELLSVHREDIELMFKEYKQAEERLVKCMEFLHTNHPADYRLLFGD